MKLSLFISLLRISFREVAVFLNFTGRVDKLKLAFIPIPTITYFASSLSLIWLRRVFRKLFSNLSKHR